jgi:hypothetical protein
MNWKRWSHRTPCLQAHWECLTATDFLSVEVYTIKGLVTYYILFCATRVVKEVLTL